MTTDRAEVRPGRSGEVVGRGLGMMQGYLDRPEASAKPCAMEQGCTQVTSLALMPKAFCTSASYKKDIISRSGENVSAAEVEEVLRAHAAVLEVPVLAQLDGLRGEAIKAHVEPVPAASNEHYLPEQLVVSCLERLAKHKVPRYVEIRTTPLPRIPTTRVNKTRLRAEDPDLVALRWDRERELGW